MNHCLHRAAQCGDKGKIPKFSSFWSSSNRIIKTMRSKWQLSKLSDRLILIWWILNLALILTEMSYHVSGSYLVYYRGLNHFLCTLEVSKLGIFICCRTGAATPTKQIYFLSIDEVSKDYIFFIAVILFYIFPPH